MPRTGEISAQNQRQIQLANRTKSEGTTIFHSTIALSILSTLLIVSCATAPSGQTFDSPIGVWNDKYKTMSGKTRSGETTIVDETGGTYISQGGNHGQFEFYSIEGQRTWKGYWIMASGSNPCSTEKSGSKYWGEQIFHFNETYNQYTGTWNSCGEGTEYPIKGVR